MDPTNTNTALTSAFAEELARCGLRHAVVSPGSRSTPLAIALFRQPGIEVTVVLDERSAGFFALGAAHSTGRPVAMLCTSGTAAANYYPAVAEADLSAVPLIVLTADRPPELRANGSGQTIDQIKLYGSAVRWFSEVGSHQADDSGLLHMRATACRAWANAAGQPRPGPVHLNFPFRDPLDPRPVPDSVTASDELALEGRPDGPLTSTTAAAGLPVEEELERLSNVIAAAERPLVIAGRQTDPALREPVCDLARRLDCPILAEPTSQLRMGPHDLGAVITGYDRIAGALLEGADRGLIGGLSPDLVIRVGETPTSKNLRIWLSGLRETTQIVVDGTWGWYEPSRTADLIVRSEPGPLLAEVAGRIGTRPGDRADPSCRDAWIAAEDELKPGSDSERAGITPREIHERLAASYTNGDLVYTASSMAIRDQESFLPKGPADVLFYSNRGANGIDGLLASGAGTAVATGRPTKVVTGELGFQHDLASLAVVAESPTPVTIVVINDGGGRIFSRLPQKQSMADDEFRTLMSTPSLIDVAAASAVFSLPHEAVSTAEAFGTALAGEGTRVIEVRLTPG